jgi:hypothetical protein
MDSTFYRRELKQWAVYMGQQLVVQKRVCNIAGFDY